MKHYDGKKIEKIPYDYALIWGQKGNGKSYYVKQRVLSDFWENGNEFVFVRRFPDECTQNSVTKQFADFNISALTGGEFTAITAYQHDLYLGKEGNKRALRCGYYYALQNEQDFAGTQLPRVRNVFFDEFFSRTYYCYDEPKKFSTLLSTLARDNEPKVYLCGNNVSKLCPYILEWGIDFILSQKEDSVVTKEFLNSDGAPALLVSHRCATDNKRNRLIIGSRADEITKGAWSTKPTPRLPMEFELYKPMYTFVIERERLRFLCYLLEDKTLGPVVYVTPKTTPAKRDTRLMTDNLFAGGELVTYGLQPISIKERVLFELIERGKICYSDNTTARDFCNVLESFRSYSPTS